MFIELIHRGTLRGSTIGRFIMVAALALAKAKTVIFRGWFLYFFRHRIVRLRSTDVFETLPHGVALKALLYGFP